MPIPPSNLQLRLQFLDPVVAVRDLDVDQVIDLLLQGGDVIAQVGDGVVRIVHAVVCDGAGQAGEDSVGLIICFSMIGSQSRGAMSPASIRALMAFALRRR